MREYLLCSGMALCLGYFLDQLFGDPYIAWHPICLIGNLISKLEKKLYGTVKDKRKGGRLLVLGVLVCVLVTVMLLRVVSFLICPYFFVVIEAVLLWFAFAQKSLQKESMKVHHALTTGTIEEARYAVSMIVGRDTKELDAAGVTKAAVETVAENTSDGIVAPLFYAMLFGAFGAYFYKAVNTMDSMVGYKNEKYMDFGRCAAKLDDVVNYIPARISAFCMLLAAKICKLDAHNAWKIFRRDRYKHASPNSAQTESVCAGALGLRLAGNAYYGGVLFEKPYIGDELRTIESQDIPRACRLMNVTCYLFFICAVIVRLLVLWWSYAV